MIEKIVVSAAGTMAGLLVAVAGWQGFHKLVAVAWAWRDAIEAHQVWSY